MDWVDAAMVSAAPAEAGLKPATPEYRPGLEGVPATQSSVCDIDGQRGRLTYRGYSVEELAQHSTFLETTYLLIWGELPTAAQLREFEHEVQMHRRVSFRIRDMMKCFPSQGHPMDALQSSAAVAVNVKPGCVATPARTTPLSLPSCRR